MHALCLASSSPRRQALLAQLGYQFELVIPDIDETPRAGETPAQLVVRLAQEKASTGLAMRQKQGHQGNLVLGSDTIVVQDGRVLGKPANRDEALATLRALSGREHQVMTAVALAAEDGCEHRLITTQVQFCALTEAQMAAYWDSGEPADKAGSYGIQGLGGNFVRAIQGSYSAVVGLPLVETRELIEQMQAKQA
ncbi:Maf family protein [Ferrimonas marina]|uniref:dTTP/UTP pyrophosphatase n=1 Tax=Ferrimonas marina TaxID=299255 RepID=A0A1M5Y2I1_9GAMM|nr:Maf family protein [Ferrimonas marina]SHI05703.1 septum formation protein [Ferrimonas marina]